MNLAIKMAVDWIDGDANRVLVEAKQLTDADDALIGDILAHMRAAQVEMQKAVAAIAVVKSDGSNTKGGRGMNTEPQRQAVVMPLGTHQGKPIRELDTRYLSWCCKNSRIFVDHLAFIPALKSELKRRRRR